MSPGTAVTALLALATSSTVALSQPTTYDIPPALNPDRLAVYLEASATGVQIYTCDKNAAGAWAWNFKAPEAALFDIHQNR